MKRKTVAIFGLLLFAGLITVTTLVVPPVLQFPHTVFVVSFPGSDRLRLAQNIGLNDTEDRSGSWATRELNDPEVNQTFFFNCCWDMIDRFQPRALCYLTEVDSALTDVNDPQFEYHQTHSPRSSRAVLNAGIGMSNSVRPGRLEFANAWR